eukprot:5433491-Pyramimonas_sp.AAC.1
MGGGRHLQVLHLTNVNLNPKHCLKCPPHLRLPARGHMLAGPHVIGQARGHMLAGLRAIGPD